MPNGDINGVISVEIYWRKPYQKVQVPSRGPKLPSTPQTAKRDTMKSSRPGTAQSLPRPMSREAKSQADPNAPPFEFQLESEGPLRSAVSAPATPSQMRKERNIAHRTLRDESEGETKPKGLGK
jgi:hypothetical protein